MPITNRIIRHRFGIMHSVTEPTLGTWLRPGDDPDAPVIPDPIRKAISLEGCLPPLSPETFGQIRDLCLDHVRWEANPDGPVDQTTEVAVILIRYGPGLSTWDAWAPEQQVNGGIVDSDLRPGHPLVCLRTGEVEEGGLAGVLTRYKPECDTYPGPAAHAGSAHSHNVMGVTFSSRDDSSELGMPGVHFIVGKIRQTKARRHDGTFIGHTTLDYDIGPSVVVDGKRYQSVIDPVTGEPRKMTADDIAARSECDRLYPYDPEKPLYHPNVTACGLITMKEPTPANGGLYVAGLGSTPRLPMEPILGFRRCRSSDTWVFCLLGGSRSTLVAVEHLPPDLREAFDYMVEKNWAEAPFQKPYKCDPKYAVVSHTNKPAATLPSKPRNEAKADSVTGRSPKFGLFRRGYAATVDEANILAEMIEQTLTANTARVPLAAWNVIHDAILDTEFFDPADCVDQEDAEQDPRSHSDESADPEVEWVQEDGTTVPDAECDPDPQDPEAVKAAIDAMVDMGREGHTPPASEKSFALVDE